jgi:hypothetical protein
VKKIILTAVTLTLAIGGASAVFAAVDDNSTRTASTTMEDVSGPCDEAEHANDPRCAGGNGRHDEAVVDHRGGIQDDDADEPRDAQVGEDVPGPCDEAEHANDPRCAAGAPAGPVGEDVVDNSGPGSVNSGPGSTSSGPSDEADDHGGESGHSGPGGGGEGDDD